MSTRDTTWPTGSPAWVDLGTDDLHAAGKAYGHLFGWDLGEASDGEYAIALKNGRAAGAIYSLEGQPTGWVLYFATDAIESTVERATSAGAAVQVAPTDVDSGAGRFALLTDPTGATFGLWQGQELTGIQIVDEPGSFVWTTLLTRDLPAARAFYAAVFDYAYDEVSDDLLTVRRPDGGLVASMHHAGELPENAPPAWNVHFCVASRDATISMAEMEDGFEVLMSFETPFGAEAVLRGPSGEVFNVTETPDSD